MADNPIPPSDNPTGPLPVDSFNELGRTGTLNFRGFLQSEDYNATLKPPNSFAVYDKMAMSDPTVHATLQHITSPIIAATYDYVPASSDPRDLEIAAFADACTHQWMGDRCTWSGVVENMLRYLRWGSSLLEGTYRHDRKGWVYTQKGGSITKVPERDVVVWDRWSIRLPRTIYRWLVEDDILRGVQQQVYLNTANLSGVRYVDIPIEKCVLLVNEQTGDDYWGTSILRAAYKPWYILENLQRLSAIGMERYLVGTPMGRMKTGSTPVQRENAIKTLMNIRGGEQTAMTYSNDDGFDVDGEANGAGTAIWILQPPRDAPDPLPLIRHLESNIFTNILARFMDLGQRETGARATAEVQRDPFYEALTAVAQKMVDEWNRGPVRTLIDLNYEGVTQYPRLRVSGISPQDIPIVARAAQMWSQFGFLTPDALTEQWIRDQIGMPDKVVDQETIDRYEQSKATQAAMPPAQTGNTNPSHDTGTGGGGGMVVGSGQREGGEDSVLASDAPWQPRRPFVRRSSTPTGTDPPTPSTPPG